MARAPSRPGPVRLRAPFALALLVALCSLTALIALCALVALCALTALCVLSALCALADLYQLVAQTTVSVGLLVTALPGRVAGLVVYRAWVRFPLARAPAFSETIRADTAAPVSGLEPALLNMGFGYGAGTIAPGARDLDPLWSGPGPNREPGPICPAGGLGRPGLTA